MDKRKIIGISIMAIGILTIISIIYMLFFNKPVTESEQGNATTPSSDKINTSNLNIDNDSPVRRIEANIVENQDNNNDDIPEARSEEEVSKDDLKRIAGSFVERFGSYSNQSNYGNIKDLRMFMSDKMRDWADAYVADQLKKTNANDIYYGIITKTISEEILKYDDKEGEVSVLVQSRRREAVGASANFSDVYSQDITVNFVKNRGAWKVDSANWDEK